MSFVFFDTETTGLSPHFDQIVQFAAIKTDHQLNETDRFEVRSRLCEHIVPHPDAIRINGIGIERLLDASLPSHYEMACQIRDKLLEWSPSIFSGYNSIGFDEEFLRQAFYQCLLPPYLTSRPGCGRADVMSLVMDAATSSPRIIEIPLRDDGRSSFKLADIVHANGLAHGRMHDALSDVRVVIEICKRLQAGAPDAWQRFTRFSNKASVADFIQGEDAFLFTNFYGGQAHHAPVVWVANDPKQPALALCLSIDAHTRKLLTSSDVDLAAAVTSRPSVIRRVRTNKAPALTPLYEIDDSTVRLPMDVDEIEDIGRAVRADAAFCQRLLALHQRLTPQWPVETHVERRIYGGFWSAEDDRLMARFHEVDWCDRPGIVRQLKDDRLRLLGRRLIYRERPDLLTAAQQKSVIDELNGRMLVADGPLGLKDAAALADELLASVTHLDETPLRQYRDYLQQRVGGIDEVVAHDSQCHGSLPPGG